MTEKQNKKHRTFSKTKNLTISHEIELELGPKIPDNMLISRKIMK